MLYGRDAERTAIGALLDAARDARSGALVLRGEAGAGKTTLLEDARERATDMHVLRARGVESESELPFAGLHQLVRPTLELVERLPSPQADALRGALGLAERPGNDRFLISVACLTLLAEVAERRALLCLVDDAQWLDTPSADALLFVARRLDAEGIVLLFAAREGDQRRFDAHGVPSLELTGLDAAAAAAVVSRRTGGTAAPAVCDLLVQQAGGNALALVELPAALTAAQLSGDEPLPDALPLTRDIERLFLERVRRLPEPTQRLLALAAADDTGRLGPVMRAAATLGIGEDALAAAESAGLVTVNGQQLDVRHPLVRSAVYQGSSSSERRASHLALAAALIDDTESDQRAWHLASAALGPDAEVADELERTAERARLRSGHAAAATGLERAAALSPDDAARTRRLVAAAGAAWQAGQPDRALTLIDRAGPIADLRLRAEAAHVRGVIQFRCGSLVDAGETLLAAAGDIAPLDARKALEMLFDAANAGLDTGDYARVADAAAAAAALPSGSDEEVADLAELLVAVSALMVGHEPPEPSRVLEIVSRVERAKEPRWLAWAAVGAGIAGDLAREKALLRRAEDVARATGAVDVLTLVLVAVAVDGIAVGRYAVAAEATEGLRLARDAGLRNPASLYLAVLSWLAAVQGRDDECRTAAAEAIEHARETGLALANSIAQWALALLDIPAGRHAEAATRLEALCTAPPPVGHPYINVLATPALVEACVRAGRDEAAERALAGIRAFAAPAAPAWVHALHARCRALCSAGADAERAFDEALTLHAAASRPYELARTELLYGEYLRRERRRTDARGHLRAALDGFDALGAVPWAERARSELRASGESARKRDPSTLAQLTPQEFQVARFVAEGLSNKEVAAQLFLSPRTIDAHLRNVFAKLGVTSRTQLARLPLDPALSVG